MKLALTLAAVCISSVFAASPAAADGFGYSIGIPPPYLGPELPNYLSPPGPARCSWADQCWYRIQMGPEVLVTTTTTSRTVVRARY